MKVYTSIAAALFVFGCDGPKEKFYTAEAPSPESPALTDKDASEMAAEPHLKPGSSPSTAEIDPIDALAAMDPRMPVPLQPMMAWHQKQNMMDHLVAVEQINTGLAARDWATVESAADRLGSSPEMKTMCEHMGMGADGFTELALEFHRRADAIGEAAERRDERGVMRATGETLQACTSCHATYRQEIVSAEEWARRTE